MRYTHQIAMLILILLLNGSCKESGLERPQLTDAFHVKLIIEYDEAGLETSRDKFTYDENQLILWQTYIKRASGELVESIRTHLTYQGDYVNVSRFIVKNGAWTLDSKSVFLICDDLVREETISRYGFPRCLDCWKYEFEYKGNKLKAWHKLTRNKSGLLTEARKGEYNYSNSAPCGYYEFEMNDNNEWDKTYERQYFMKNGLVSGWHGGICLKDGKWCPDQKIDYLYANGAVAERTYYIRNETSGTWQYFGTINYSYDPDQNLIEKTSSNGIKTVYFYEPGNGNASHFYNDAEDLSECEPYCKSTIIP